MAPAVPYTLAQLAWYFLRLGTTGFGGPIALVGYMQRDLVERRGWIALEDYKEGLTLAQLAPGPLAAQLAIYVGWLRHGVVGATVVAIAFVLPSFLIVLALSAAYLAWGGIGWMRGAFYGVGAAVIAIIARSAWKLAASTLAGDRVLWAIFAVSAAVTLATESELVWVFVGGGLLALALRAPRRRATAAMVGAPWLWLVSGLHGPAGDGVLWRIAAFFTEAGAFVFGSGLAIVPFLHGGVVHEYRWLDERQFLDAVAVAMITPGPVVITVAFIGYLVAGPLGATLAAFAVFFPCWVFTVVPARWFRQSVHDPRVRAFVNGVTAAASGAIAGAAGVLGRRAIVDVPTALLFLATLAALLRVRRVPEPAWIVAAGVLGVAMAA